MDASPSAACSACAATLSPGARYCHRCGRAATGGGRAERTAWIAAWSAVVVCLGLITYYVVARAGAPAAPDMANAGNVTGEAAAGRPPDISQMSPRERFLRLHDRVMAADQSGDTATATRFLPMALAAYGMLDQVDADLRYHQGALQIRAGDYPAALALADTIQAESPGNLMADLLRIEVADAQKDSAARTRAARSYLEHYDRQIALPRPEYRDHRAMLEDLKTRLQR